MGRDHFLQDPFFKSAWEDMDTFRGSFFKDSQSQSAKMIETSEKKEEKNEDSGFKNKFGRFLVPRKWLMPSSLWSGEERGELKEENKKIKMERKKSVEKKEESKSVDQIKVEQRSGASAESTEKKARTTSVVPLNLRESFFDDPFFKDSWLDIQQSQRDFFSLAEERFNQQMKMLESTRDNFGFSSLTNINKDFDLDLPKLSLRDAEELKVFDGGDKVEVSLDTAGYKPDELKVTAGRGVVCVEGKHEEKSQSGEVMVSRQMSRQYQLPSSADPAQVTSNLSRDGVLLITIPKIQQQINQDRNVPITMN